MAGKLISTLITLFMITYILLMVSFFFLHEDIKEAVNDINYSTAEAFSTSGTLNEPTYRLLRDSLSKYGSYGITFKLEKQLKQGIYDTFYDSAAEIDQALKTADFSRIDVLNRQCQQGDRLTIYVEGKSPTVFERLVNATVYLWSPKRQVDGGIKSLKTATVGIRNKNLLTGYDALADIRKVTAESTMAVQVVTRLNKSGKYYGDASHEYVAATNLYYGDDADEKSGGVNYVLESGSFLRETEYYPSGKVKLLKYIQQ